ncbi:MAG: hypothetical protein ACREQB_08805 [Candidatus Binataceae bacterium]
MRAIGIYREPEYSPGKVDDDAAILDAVLGELVSCEFETSRLTATQFAERGAPSADLLLAMCQGDHALQRLAEIARSGAVVINSALAIRNCYRDLLSAGLARAGVPVPPGLLVDSTGPLDRTALGGLELADGVYVKRGDLHALGPDDVQRVESAAQLDSVLRSFARRGIARACLQQEVKGRVVKFYGVSDQSYFAVIEDGGTVAAHVERRLGNDAQRAASALGLEVWGGDAVLCGDRFTIIDFNDWPSMSRVRHRAARAIAKRAMILTRAPH